MRQSQPGKEGVAPPRKEKPESGEMSKDVHMASRMIATNTALYTAKAMYLHKHGLELSKSDLKKSKPHTECPGTERREQKSLH